MVYRQLRSIGRFVLVGCAVSLGASSLSAQTAPSAPAPIGPNPSRVDVFVGYSYFGTHSTLKPSAVQYGSDDYGAIGSGAYYFNKYIGAEGIFVAHPDGTNDSLYTVSRRQNVADGAPEWRLSTCQDRVSATACDDWDKIPV